MAVIRRIDITVVDPGHALRWTDRAKDSCLTTTIVRVVDDEGAEGLAGSDSYTPAPSDLSVLEAVRSMWPALKGLGTDRREELAQDLRVGVVFPFSTAPLALIDVALWDLTARRAGLPLWRLLGGARERLPAYASLSTMDAEADYLDVVGRARDEGIGAVKVHAWGEPDRDLDLLRRLRDAYPELALMHDAEGVYDRRGALRVARGLEDIDCRWFEAPLPDFDLAGYRDLRRRVDVPILPAGYAMWDDAQLAEALRDPPWSAVRAEIGCTLGITALCRQIELARAFGMDLEPVSYGHALSQVAALHVMLAYDNVSYFELPYPFEPWEYGVANPVRADDAGTVTVPDGDGLGIRLDWDEIDAMTTQRITLEA